MGGGCLSDIESQISAYVGKELKQLSTNELKTIHALLYSGYKGEREEVLLGLLKLMELDEVFPSSLTESFKSSFEDGTEAVYWRIKPEFYRAVRHQLKEFTF